MPNVKGSAILARTLWVSRQHGDDGTRRLQAALAPATAELLRANVLKSSWYPFEAFVDLNVTIDRLWGHGDLELVRSLGRFGAEVNLKTIYRLFYMVGRVSWVLDRAAALWHVNYDAGRLATFHRDDHSVEMHIVDFPTPHRSHCLSVMGWAERSVELSGGRIVESHEPSCRARGDAACTLSLSWR